MTFGRDGNIASESSKKNTLIKMKAGELYGQTVRGSTGRSETENKGNERNGKKSNETIGQNDGRDERTGGEGKTGSRIKASIKESGSAYLEEEHIAESIEKIEAGLGITGVSAYINKKDTSPEVAVSEDPSRYVQDEAQSDVSINSINEAKGKSKRKNSFADADALTADNDARIRAYRMEQEGKKKRKFFKKLVGSAEQMENGDLKSMIAKQKFFIKEIYNFCRIPIMLSIKSFFMT